MPLNGYALGLSECVSVDVVNYFREETKNRPKCQYTQIVLRAMGSVLARVLHE